MKADNFSLMRKSLFPLLLALIFFSCNSPKTSSGQADSAISEKPATASATVNKTPVLFKGMYTYGKGLNTFMDCSSQITYWVNDSLAPLKEPYQKAVQPLPYPNESVYAEVKGYLSGKANVGPAHDYENVLVVTDIMKVEAKNFRTECYNYEFIAKGNEPFWSLEIVPTEQQIVLKDISTNKVYQFPYQPANSGGGVHRFETTDGAKNKLVVVIREEPCSDGMSDQKYRYSAEVVINGRTLKGCAIKKGDDAGKAH